MGSFLFIEGDSGEGKTTLLFECLKAYKEITGGFYSQRLIDENGLTRGFRMVSAREDWVPRFLYQPGLSNIFIEKTKTGWKKHLEIFEEEGVNMLSSSKDRKLILMDEIGGVELFSLRFMKTVFECIDGELPCIGVLKSRENFQSMSTRVPVKQEAHRRLCELEEELRRRSWGSVLTFERKRKESFHKEIMEFLGQNILDN